MIKESDDFTVISINKDFPLFKKSQELFKNMDGSILESHESGNGYSLCIHFNGVTKEEIDMFRDKRIETRVIVSLDGLVVPLFRFEDTPLIFELYFDPFAYGDNRALQLIDKNNVVSVYLVDSSNNILKAMRQANLPLEFIKTCKKYWVSDVVQESYSDRYKIFFGTLQSKMSVFEMWSVAKHVGFLGESFDLDEINK